MQLALQVLMALASLLVVATIALYATCLLLHRLHRREAKGPAFGEWVRHLFEAVWGLG